MEIAAVGLDVFGGYALPFGAQDSIAELLAASRADELRLSNQVYYNWRSAAF